MFPREIVRSIVADVSFHDHHHDDLMIIILSKKVRAAACCCQLLADVHNKQQMKNERYNRP
jgi:hypothetical protein